MATKRSTLTVNLKVVVTFDREKMTELAAAVTFIDSLEKGNFIPIPDGVNCEVKAEKPKLVNHSD
jgi:hypothetical protein